MRLGFALLLLVCLIGMAVSEYRDKEEEERVAVMAAVGAGIGAANLVTRIRWGRWGKKRFYQRSDPRARLEEVFQILDSDASGFIESDELDDDYKALLKGHTDKPEIIMTGTDTDKDGKISFDEFYTALAPSNGGDRRRY